MTYDKKDIEAGKILIAQPYMQDGHFKRSVIGLTEHNDEGTLGFILNKQVNIQLPELIPDVSSEEKFKIYFGGPVATDTIHYLHNVGELLEESVKIHPGIYWGGNFEKLIFLINSGLIQKDNIRFYIGYSGWSAGQLFDEMHTGTWIISNWFANYIFQTKPDNLWEQALKHKGNTYEVISQIPTDQNEN